METIEKQKNIPDEWGSVPVGDVFCFVKSYAFSRENLINSTENPEGIGNIHYGDIHSTFTSPSINLGDVSIPAIKDRGFSPKKEEFLRDGDLIMADVSEDYEGIGVTVSVHGLKDKRVVGGLHTFVLRDDKGKTNEYYRQYIFRNPKIRNTLQKVANGVSVYGISKAAVSKVILPLPPLSEQNRIVAVLETWDRAIEKLTKKIEIKKEVKKHLMQQLLTGKTRLPGFKEKWKEFQIGTFSKLVTLLNVKDKHHEVLSCTKYRGLVRSLEYFDRKVYGNDLTKYKIVPRDHFVYATNHIEEGSIGHQNLIDFGLVSPMYTVFETDGVNNLFLSKLLKTPRLIFEYQRHMTASVERRGGLRWGSFSKIKLYLPLLEEQNAIADFTKVAGREISQLEHKLSLLEDQKKYLLNNLITGAIRTPEKMKVKW